MSSGSQLKGLDSLSKFSGNRAASTPRVLVLVLRLELFSNRSGDSLASKSGVVVVFVDRLDLLSNLSGNRLASKSGVVAFVLGVMSTGPEDRATVIRIAANSINAAPITVINSGTLL